MTNSSTSSSKESSLFFRRLAGFTFLLLVVLLILSIINYKTIITKLTDTKELKLPQQTEILVMGDSQAMTGIDPSLRDNVLNCAKRAELLSLTYRKLRFIHAHNKHLKSIILTVNPHSFSGKRDVMLQEQSSIVYYCDHFFYVYDREMDKLAFSPHGAYYLSWLKFRLGVPFELSKNASQFMRILTGSNRYYYYPFWGGFTKVDSLENMQSVDKYLKVHYYFPDKNYRLSNIMIDYFKRIVNYCKLEGLRLIVVSMPLHKDYYAGVPEIYKSGMHRVLEEMISNGNGVYLDYAKYPMSETDWFDYYHLNEQGALKFSEELYEKIENLNKGADYDD